MSDTNRVLFGAEFESEGFINGVDQAIMKLREMKDEERLLKEEIADGNKTLKQNEQRVKDLKKELAGMQPVSKVAIEQMEALKKQIQGYEQANVTVTKSIAAAKKDLVSHTEATKNYSKEVTKLAKEEAVLSNSIQKATSIKALASQGVNQLKGHMISLAQGGVIGLASAVTDMLLPVLVEWGQEIIGMSNKLSDLQLQQKLNFDIESQAAASYGKEKAELEVLVHAIQSEGTSRKEKMEILLKLQKEYPGYFDNIKTEKDLVDKLPAAYEAATQGILLKAKAQAAQNILAENFEKRLKAEAEFERRKGVDNQQFKNELRFGYDREKVLKAYKFRAEDRLKDYEDEVRDVDKMNKVIIDKIIGFNDKITDLGGKNLFAGADKKGPDNVFDQMFADIKARIAAATDKGFQSEGLIEKKYKAQLDKEIVAIVNHVKKGSLTADQGETLKEMQGKLFGILQEADLKVLHEKQQAAMDRMQQLQEKYEGELRMKKIANIRDDFEKEKQQIEAGYEQQSLALTAALKKLKADIDKEIETGFLSEEDGAYNKGLLDTIFGRLDDEAFQQAANAKLELAFKTFQKTIKDLQDKYQEEFVEKDEFTASLVGEQTKKFLAGEISYKIYQQNLTKIQKNAADDRRRGRLEELEFELKAINEQITKTTDAELLGKLKAQQLSVRSAIAGLRNGEVDKPPTWLTSFMEYAKATQEVLNQVAGFWQAVNQAEARSLERSIALQNRRVQNAKEIAEKGNAEYLEMEQKRLDELERKREENARKQLAINNALTLSNATVAAIGAIAKAVEQGGALAAIGAVAAVIGTITAAFSFVNSLQPQVPTFFEGTEYLQGVGAPMGKDTVPARLHIGERVVTSKDNQQYWDTLHAIHNHLIPAEALNSFVNSYPNAGIPALDFDRLSSATKGKLGADSFEVLGRLDRLNGTMERVVETMDSLGLNVSMDENGLAASFEKIQTAKRIRSKA